MNLYTVQRRGDGLYKQICIPIIEEIDMKLKCTFCLERNGNAVKTDLLFLIPTVTGDKLGCTKCKERLQGRKDNEYPNSQFTRSEN